MPKFSHKCVKCQAVYEDGDEDDFYCESCTQAKMLIAQEIDAKSRPSTRPVKSDLQIFDEIAKMRRSRFVSIKDLGITL